jgi:adenylylsulfate kinase-like enzyme
VGFVVWVTGLSGSGKSSICRVLYQKLKQDLHGLVLLDGDDVRAAFGHDLGYEESDRVIQVKRVQALARMLAAQGISVIVAVVYCSQDLMRWNRVNIPNYLEVYLETSMETVVQRDSKGLYSLEKNSGVVNVVGVDIPWNPPPLPDLTLNGNGSVSPESLADKILECLSPWRSAPNSEHA